MPLERNNVVNSFKTDAETRLDNDQNQVDGLNGQQELDNHRDINAEEVAEHGYLDGP